MSKESQRSGPSRGELQDLDREVRVEFPVSPEHHLYLFRLLRHCIRLADGKPELIDDPIARALFHRLWVLNSGLANLGARRFGPFKFSVDAVQDAHLGLRKGLLRFDPGRGVKPSSYLMWWVRHAISRNFANSENGAITLQTNARRRIKNGEVERPIVFSYHAYASRHGIDEIDQLMFMRDRGAPSIESQVDARQHFAEQRKRLMREAAHVEREHQMEYILFTLESGFGRFPRKPVKMKVLKRLTGLKEGQIRDRVRKAVKHLGRRCGIRDVDEARRLIEALVEYSLHYGIPL